MPVLPQVLIAVFLLLAPGLLVALALRFRSFDALALAPALSVGVIVLTATSIPFIGLPFGFPAVAATAAVLAAAGLWLCQRYGPLVPGSQYNDGSVHCAGITVGRAAGSQLAPFVAVLLAGGLIAWRTVQVLGTPVSFSQTYDAVFHLNSVRFALDTGQASSLTIGGMTGGGFYPAGWNAVATLVASVTGSDVPQAVNITTIVIASVFWPLGCVLLATWIAGRSSAAAIAAGISSASLGAFPLLMMDFGVLYPNLLAISVLPACIALAARLLGVSVTDGQMKLPATLALLLSLAGLMVSHPTTFMAWLVWTLPMVAFAFQRSASAVEAAPRTGGSLSVRRALIAIYVLVYVALWIFLRPPEEASFWGPYHTVPQAFGEALLVSPMDLAPAWLLIPLLFLGFLACYRNPRRFGWIGVVFIIFAGLFVLVSGFPKSPLRNFMAGVWYNDSYRIAALLPVAAILLAAVGVAWAEPWVRAWVRRLTIAHSDTDGEVTPRARFLQRAVGVLLVLAAIAIGQQGGLKQEAARASTQYAVTERSPLVSDDELAVLRRLGQTVPAGSTVLGNPYTGAALSYALGNRRAAQLHILSNISPELQEIYEDLGKVSSDPAVCDAIRDEDAYYVLDFGTYEVHGGDHTPPGLRHLDRNPGLELLDSQGDAKLYKITSCG
ncbi:hypothetical protein FJ661_07175 [Pseudarthrobacter phenanthrenivorans]|uniref:DUF6541 family protein n=1 Tax=Pseudarthrobacter phenanthrenivorans TaxID=361575 RepID=UPI00112E966D|nr:DUF6541 family protein [Pseudarthrobacter phenanthrenivorans]TPV52173.1 hypothetical protein FJ661_07175 [Pseudarthrobacter phenanthrenivorans]